MFTADAAEARRLVRLLESGQPLPRDPAAVADEVFSAGAPAASLPKGDGAAVGAGGAGAPPPEPQPAGDSGSWAADATAAAGGGASSASAPASAQPLSSEESTNLAQFLTAIQVEGVAMYARAKVWDGFATPPIPEPMHQAFVGSWRAIIDYSGKAMALPPWVMGAVVPGVVLVSSTFALGRMFIDEAKRQKAAAGAPGGT